MKLSHGATKRHTLLWGKKRPGIRPDATPENVYFEKVGTHIFVIDAQDEPYTPALEYAKSLITKVYHMSPSTNFEIFVHKVDGDLFVSEE